MVRMQVQLTDRQMEALRKASATTGKSISELIRQGVDRYFAGGIQPDREERIKRAIGVAGRFSSGVSNVSTDHDKHLAEAFGR